jgi:hypothetical protein
MKISNLAFNSSQRLANLAHGLNVVFHKETDAIRSLHEAANQVFFGEPAANGEPAELDIVERGQTIRLWRSADSGELVARKLNAVPSEDLSIEDLGELEQQISEPSDRYLYHPEFGSRADFDQLVQKAREFTTPPKDKFSLQTLLSELEQRDKLPQTDRFKHLQGRRDQLLNDISTMNRRLRSVELDNRDSVENLRHNIADTEQRLEDLGVRRDDLRADWERDAQQDVELPTTRELTTHRAQLQLQIERVQAVLRDLDRTIDQSQPSPAITDAPQGGQPFTNDRDLRLKNLALRLQQSIDQLTTYANEKESLCKEHADVVAERFSALARVVDDIAGNPAVRLTDPERIPEETQRLTACRRQLKDHLNQILSQRNDNDVRPPAMSVLAAGAETVCGVPESRLALDEIIRQIEQKQTELRQDIEHLDRLTTADGEADRLSSRLRNIEQELADTEREIEHEQRFANLRRDDFLTRLQEMLPEVSVPPLIKDLNRLVRELTAGEYVSIDMPKNRRDLVVVNEHNESFSSDILSRSTRDLLQTAVVLAIAIHQAGHGKVRTIVLFNALQHVPASRLRACIDILLDFTRSAHQVILLTSQSNVLSLAKSLGICCFDCDQRLSYPIETIRPSIHEAAWDCEEFPGELRDRTRNGWTNDGRRQLQLSRQRDLRPGSFVGSEDHIADDDTTATISPLSNRSVVPESGSWNEDDFPIELMRVTGHYLELSDRITEMPFVSRPITAAMTDHGVWTVANLLHADPMLLAERMHDLNVVAAEIRQWQAQARLMCGVRKLRGYDARILVGCGITTAGQLEGLHPAEVLRLVEAFVATPEGSQIVRSGTAVETDRVTRWIRSLQRTSGVPLTETTRRARPNELSDHKTRGDCEPENRGETVNKSPRRRTSSSPPASQVRKNDRSRKERSRVLPMKFHLEPDSHVEAAPTIGPRMAERLEAIQIVTVADLLAAEPTDVVEQLQHRRTTAEVVCQWQQQAELVCRIPQLRGHDAQILVACDITIPAEIADYNPRDLLAIVDPFCSSTEGKRLLRNNKHPDLDEVIKWVEWAKQARQLEAA